MKVILLFALFCLGFYQAAANDSKCPDKPVPYGDDKDCLLKALVELSEFFPSFAKYVCDYTKSKENNDDTNLKEASRQFIEFAACTGCKVDQIVQGYDSFEKLLKDIADGVVDGAILFKDILKHLKIDDATAKLICDLGGSLLASDCLKNAIGTNAPTLVTDLKNLYCKAKKGKSDDAAKELAALLVNIGCGLDGQLKTKQELENALKSLGDLIVPLLKLLLEALGVVAPVICPALTVVGR